MSILIRDGETTFRVGLKNFSQHTPLPKPTRCIVPISVGQSYHEGKIFEASIQLLNHHFDSCVIMLCDLLQRHTYQMESSLVGFATNDYAVREGDAWLMRNKNILSQLNIACDIRRWSEQLYSQTYKTARTEIDAFYKDNIQYRLSVDEVASNFARRKLAANKLDPEQHGGLLRKYYELSTEYLKEESSVRYSWLGDGYDFHFYPKPDNLAMKVVHKQLIVSEHPQELIPINLKVKKIKHHAEQKQSMEY